MGMTGISLDAVAADRAGRDLADAGHDLAAARRTLGAAADAAGHARPWGADEIGAAFDQGYAAAARSVLDGWTAIAARIAALGAATTRAATDLTTADDRAATRAATRAGEPYR